MNLIQVPKLRPKFDISGIPRGGGGVVGGGGGGIWEIGRTPLGVEPPRSTLC